MSQGFHPIMGNDCLGARLLSEISEPPRRLFEREVERGELGGNQQVLPGEREVERRVTKRSSNRCGVQKGCRQHPFLFCISSCERRRISRHGRQVAQARATPKR